LLLLFISYRVIPETFGYTLVRMFDRGGSREQAQNAHHCFVVSKLLNASRDHYMTPWRNMIENIGNVTSLSHTN